MEFITCTIAAIAVISRLLLIGVNNYDRNRKILTEKS